MDDLSKAGQDPAVIRLLKKAGPGRFLDEQKALRQWATMLNRNVGPGQKASVMEMAENNPLLAGLSDAQRRKLQSHLSIVTGDVGEVYLRAIMERGRMAEFVEGN